jgi:hypothetical protein
VFSEVQSKNHKITESAQELSTAGRKILEEEVVEGPEEEAEEEAEVQEEKVPNEWQSNPPTSYGGSTHRIRGKSPPEELEIISHRNPRDTLIPRTLHSIPPSMLS